MNAVYVDFMLANRKDNHEEKRRRRHVGGCIWLKLLLLVSTLTANYELTTAQYKPDVKCGFQENAVFKFKTLRRNPMNTIFEKQHSKDSLAVGWLNAKFVMTF